jgi:pilus assembly protein CpaF
MLEIQIESPDGSRHILQAPDDCGIGKGAHNEVRLESWRVGKEHARVFTTPAGLLVADMGALGGVLVNGSRIDAQHGPLQPHDVIAIGPFKLRVSRLTTPAAPAAQAAAPDPVPAPSAACAASAGATSATAPPPAPERDALRHEFEWRRRIHGKLIDTMDLRRHDVSAMSDEHLRRETEALLRQILSDLDAEIPPDIDRALLCRQVLDEAVGLGPLEVLLADERVTEIMVNRHDEIYVEQAGRLQRHPLSFTGDRAVMGVIERIVAPLGRRIDESSPMVDARLKDGSRVNAIIPPLALKGACLTIRKFARHKLTADDLVRFGSLSPAMARFLEVCVVARKNVVVSGGTGSGKTTLLNILSNFIPAGERIVTVEDAAELRLHHEHLVSLESRPANAEGKGAVPIRELVRNTLRMRPDRIVVGECRGGETLDMLQAMNTGHDGSLTTLHANTPRDALARLETMVLMAGMDLPLTAIREQVASAVHLIVQQTRFACGSRRVTSITEVCGMESGKLQLQELFRFEPQGYGGGDGRMRGHFTGCDTVPSFYETLRAMGQAPALDIFKPVPAPLREA